MKILGIAVFFLTPVLTNQALACTVGQVSWINGCQARCIASWPGPNNSCADECLATTPLGYTRVNHSAQVVSQNNGGHSVSLLEAGQQHDYTSKTTIAYQEAIDLAIKYKDLAAEAKLRQEMQQALAFAIHAKTNKQTVQVKVSASRRGSIFNRVRGWSDVKVKLKVRCLAPANLAQQIIAKANIQDRRTKPVKDCSKKVKWFNGTMKSAGFDGANCFIYKPPSNAKPFIYDNNYYVIPDSAGICSLGGWDGANCYLGSAPANTKAFLYKGSFYY